MTMLQIDGLTVPYRVVRTRRTRRMSLRVGPTGLTVTVPARCSARRVRELLDQDAAWIAAAWRGVVARTPDGIIHGARLPFLDSEFEVRITDVTRVRRAGAQLHVPRDVVPEAAIEQWMRGEARRDFRARIDHWAPIVEASPARLVVAGQRSRWGSASARGTVSLNWRLMLTPGRVVDYVVVHELCHLHHPDHSRHFWERVGRHLPDFERDRTWLREHGARVLMTLRPPLPVR
ncbi:MAG: M48 family metallopeptidase [Thermoleophilia bacterium]|nr:M48 family metallopeptidase [Thermoleophilia bacterium]